MYQKRKGVRCEGVRFVNAGRKLGVSKVFGAEHCGTCLTAILTGCVYQLIVLTRCVHQFIVPTVLAINIHSLFGFRVQGFSEP